MNDLPVATSFARNGPKGSSATLPLGTTGTGAATANNVGNNTAANRVNTDVFYVHPDHLGTPRVVSKPADNKKVWEWNSSPFGETAPNENPQGLTGTALTAGQFRYNLRFPGQFFDAESGKHYNYFRDYDASIGRYVESDPIGILGGINTFVYSGAIPITQTDPKGLLNPIPTVTACAIGCATAALKDLWKCCKGNCIPINDFSSLTQCMNAKCSLCGAAMACANGGVAGAIIGAIGGAPAGALGGLIESIIRDQMRKAFGFDPCGYFGVSDPHRK